MPLVAVQAPLISQGPGVRWQKMALQNSPWACQIRGRAARRGGEWVPRRRQHVDLDGHDFWCACLPFAPLDMVSKPKSSAPPAERKGAWQWPGPRTRRRISHDRSCSRGPKGPTRCPQHLSSPWPLSDTGEHATLGCSRSCSRVPKGPTRCPQHLSSPWPLSDTGEHATLGCSRSFGRPHILGARDCLLGLCGPAVDVLRDPAQPGGSPAK